MKCNYDTLLDKIGVNKLDKNVEATLEVLSDLPDCRKINTKRYVDVKYAEPAEGEEPVDATPSYNRYSIPENVFECMRTGCINSGTLTANGAGEVIFRAQFDAVEFAAGVITLYVDNIADGTEKIDVKVSSTDDFANADVYSVSVASLVKGKDGFTPIVIDLSQTPSSVVGEGWSASRNGAYISISTDETMGISSIAIFDSMEDFETSTVVKVGCLSELSTDFEIDAAEATCLSSGYDTSSDPEIERTITGNKVTPNYWMLNPLIGKGNSTEGYKLVTAEKTVEAEGEYGVVTLTDIAQDECGFLTVTLQDNCNVTDAQMLRLTVPSKIDVDEKHYFAINEDDGTTKLYFNKTHVGAPIVVSYPQTAEVEEQIGDAENIGSKRVRYTEIITYTDGTQEIFVFNNVLVTSFPFTINEDETEFSFTINIQKDADGHYFRKYRILN